MTFSSSYQICLRSRKLFSVDLGRYKIWFRKCSAYSSIDIYTEIFKERKHFLIPEFSGKDANLVVDLGANEGYYTLKLKQNNSKCKVIAIEPNPLAFEILKKKDEPKAWLWWLSFVEGKSPRTHLNEFMQKTGRKRTWVYTRLKQINEDQAFWGFIAEVRGTLWEKYLKKSYEDQGYTVFDEKENLQRFGIKADLLIAKGDEFIEVINAKCGSSGTAYPPEKFQPEIELARKLGIPAYIEFFDVNKGVRIKKQGGGKWQSN